MLMKRLKTWHLFALVIIIFACSFYYINSKYDPFYRVKGINNENRQLISKYLTKSEQDYLVENQIPMSQFVRYIKYDDFHLQNYQYYNMLRDTDRYKSTTSVLKTGNALVKILSSRYDTSYYKLASTIIEDDLEYALIHDSSFNDDNVAYYAYLRPLYSRKDTSFVQDTQTYLDGLATRNITGEDAENFLSEVTSEYTKSSLKTLMSDANDPDIHLVTKPSSNDLILNSTNYVGSYVPKTLTLIQDVNRLKYAMYIRYDAYNALVKMYQQAGKEDISFIVYQAYTSYKELPSEAKGHNEFQLGLSLSLTSQGIPYKDFKNCKASKWLSENSYKYGFILRYPKSKTAATGHTYDAHIYRYVGTSLAKKMHDEDLSLEETENNKLKPQGEGD